MSQPCTAHSHPRRRTLHAADRRAHDDHRLERLIRRLPEHRQGPVRWLRSPAARWVRLPLGVLFILGSLLFILPIFGLWMLPVGLLILAEDVPILRRMRTRLLNWIERHRPHWFSEHLPQITHQQVTDKEETT
jgi:hypothetical protein